MAAGLGMSAWLLRGAEATAIDWQPVLACQQPWRAWSAVFVHYSALHLWANLAGVLLVGTLGITAKAPLRSSLAWCVAWPLAQLGLLAQPELLHYGGLSGVLHAGVAIIAMHLLFVGNVAQRRIGVAMLVALVAKVCGEAPWRGPLRYPPGWDIAVAPLAHASGVLAGLLCSVLVEAWHRGHARKTLSL